MPCERHTDGLKKRRWSKLGLGKQQRVDDHLVTNLVVVLLQHSFHSHQDYQFDYSLSPHEARQPSHIKQSRWRWVARMVWLLPERPFPVPDL